MTLSSFWNCDKTNNKHWNVYRQSPFLITAVDRMLPGRWCVWLFQSTWPLTFLSPFVCRHQVFPGDDDGDYLIALRQTRSNGGRELRAHFHPQTPDGPSAESPGKILVHLSMSSLQKRLAHLRRNDWYGNDPDLLPPVSRNRSIDGQRVLRSLPEMQETIALGGHPSASGRDNGSLSECHANYGLGPSRQSHTSPEFVHWNDGDVGGRRTGPWTPPGTRSSSSVLGNVWNEILCHYSFDDESREQQQQNNSVTTFYNGRV